MVVFERQLTISGNKRAVPYASLLTLSAAGFSPNLTVKLGENDTTLLNLDGVRLTNDVTIARIVAQSSTKNKDLFGKTCFEQAKVEEVVCLAENVLDGYLSAAEILASIAFAKDGSLLGGRLTVADFAVWAILATSDELQKKYSALFNKILEDPTFVEALAMSGKYASKAKTTGQAKEPKERVKDEGKFVELPGAEKGKVIVRFPPEASGYLHIGHAKAALLNQYYQQAFDGKLIMRFDDTNPAKENAHFEKVILEDLEMLEIKPDIWSHSSDYFETMLEMAEKLLKESKAFVDDTDTETMRKEREERVESKNRNASVETNMALWEEMKKGSERGMQCCVRIKMDMNSNNGAMRDPTIYRCKPEEHVRTGTRYKVYPTYDFTCPIVDSIEGVTHTLRTTEYHDRDDQYYFICEALGLRKPYIWEYARLNMTNTVMSKRKLTWFVEERHVEGWDDPRLPTVRGVMRRGMTVEGLKQFIVAQGGSRSVVMMEWDKIWAFNKKVIDPVVPRYTALEEKNVVPVIIDGAVESEEAEVALHPKNADIGTKKILRGSKLLVEQTDAREFKVGDTVTFVNWGNLKIAAVERKGDQVVSVKATLDLDNKDYKKTMKVTWLGNTAPKSHIPVVCAEYDHIISKAVIGKDEDWKQYINYDSVHYTKMIGEPCLAGLKKGDIIQVQRKGFYICDHVYSEKSEFSGNETPLLLIFIPDGSTKKDVAKTETPAPAKLPKIEAAGVYAEIEQQGLKVRDLKAKDPKGAAAQAAIKELLELKKQYKALTGDDYQPGKPPAVPTGIPAPASSNSAGDLTAQIENQGALVRELKGKDPKGAAAQEAIKALLTLKLKYKETTGQEYKSGATPAAPKPAACGGNDLAQQIEVQGTLVRELKGKDPKRAAAQEAIAKLLDLKKQYKTATGQEYKPGQASPAPASGGNDLIQQIETQGTLVRELKSKDPKGAAAQEAIKTLLALKLKYKETTGQEYKPGAAPAAPKPAPASSNSAADLSAQIDAQGTLVRELKGKDPKGAAAQEAIAKLLDLKKQYKAATGQEYKPGQAASATSPSNGEAAISAEIEKQGNLVRELKSKDAKSPETKAAIERLLALKKDYKSATGKDYQPPKK